ncbi:MAG: tripartite tricarboxylate transporter TctB family protein [Spirochaetales bacterium]|nr:tripartite tricarboxylate transporter TctB family protein [Candidatus Physcosoma equi]
MNNKTRDMVFAICTIIFGAYLTGESLKIVKVASQRPFNVEKFSLSPGMLPTVLGFGLIFFAVCLLYHSCRVPGQSMGKTLKDNASNFTESLKKDVKDPNIYRMVIGMIIMAVFTFVLIGLRIGGFQAPFWLTGGIFMFVLLMYLGAVNWWKSLIITVVAMALINVLFIYAFKAILP